MGWRSDSRAFAENPSPLDAVVSSETMTAPPRTRLLVVVAVLAGVVALVATACSSEADAFEACEQPGGTVDVCEPGTVCGRSHDKLNLFACVPICEQNKDCPHNQECHPVEGSGLKGCRV